MFELVRKYNLPQVLRFLVVGLLNTGFSYLIYAILLFLGLNFALANLGAVMLGILFSFRTQGAFVFNNTDGSLLGRFILAWTVVYLVTISIIWGFVEYGFDPYTSGALALPFSAVASFFVQKFYVFREKAKPS